MVGPAAVPGAALETIKQPPSMTALAMVEPAAGASQVWQYGES